MKLVALSLVSVMLLTACPEEHGPPPIAPTDTTYQETADDGVDTKEGQVCRKLRNVGCPEGFRDARTNRTCYQRQVDALALAPAPYDCVLRAKSQDDVRECGTKDERRFRCRMPTAGAS